VSVADLEQRVECLICSAHRSAAELECPVCGRSEHVSVGIVAPGGVVVSNLSCAGCGGSTILAGRCVACHGSTFCFEGASWTR
jgi:hypothetical protein